MGIHSGKYGRINGIDTMRQWTIAEQAAQPKAVASNTLLGTARKRGVHSWNGSYQAYGAQPVPMPGNIFHFKGYGAPSNDTAGSSGTTYEGDAMCSQVSIAWDWKAGAIIGHTVTFAGHLELTKESAADPGDSVTPNLLETTGTKVQWSAGSLNSFADLPNVTQATLNISALVEAYVNSSTYVNGKAWTGQKSGPIDWNLSIGQQDDERLTSIFDIDDVVEIKLFTDSTHFWKLTYGIVRDFGGITVNRETGAIIARTINVDMNGYYGSTHGAIVLPDTTQWWPF